MSTAAETVLIHAMRRGCFYRLPDLCAHSGLSFGQVRWAIGKLHRGQVVEKVRNRGERSAVWITKQEHLPL